MTRQSNKIYFHEVQRFRQAWLWMMVLPIALIGFGIFAYIMYKQLVLGQAVGNRPIPDDTLIWFGPLMILVSIGGPLLLYINKLDVTVDSRAIFVHFKPYLKKEFLLANIESCHARKYRPIREYGGWGVRWSPGGRAYNICGNLGVQLEFKDGRRVLIGSQRAEELAAAINSARAQLQK